MLDSLARRYGQRPSVIARGDTADFQLDLLALAAGWKAEKEAAKESGAATGKENETNIYW
jgi:hypothetical protein